jgi:dipeptidyl-peptidase III
MISINIYLMLSQVINPLTGKPMYVLKFQPLHRILISHRTSWYKPEQTPGSVLGEVSSSMEECRAETVALFRMYFYALIWSAILI